MEHRKLGLFLLLLLFQLHLLRAYSHVRQNPSVIAFNQEQNVMDKGMPEKLSINVGVKREISVDRRGGGSGGHGGGHGSGHGGHSEGGRSHSASGEVRSKGEGSQGTKSPNLQGGVVVPLYAAGAMNHHRIYHHQHGSNSATLNHIGLHYLVFAISASLVYIIVWV